MSKNLPVAESRLPELVEGAAAKMTELQNSAADVEREELLALGRSLGQMETATFFRDISEAGMLSAFETVKKSKAWRSLRGKDGEKFPSLDAFCQERFGYSDRRLRQISGNRDAVGQDLFEQAERLGLRQADYNVIKALPAPKQEIIKEALTEGASKEEVQRALRELAAADQKEISGLEETLAEATAEKEATEKVLADKQAHITKLERKLHTKVAAVTDWGDAITPLCDQAAEAGRKIAQAFTQLAEVRKAACTIETADEAERDRLEQAFAHLARKFGSSLAECARLLDAEERLYQQSLAAFAEGE